MSVEVEMVGLEALKSYFRTSEERADVAARLSVTDTSAFARRLSSKEIRAQTRFTVSYLGEDGRLEVVKTADPNEAIVRGRHRATSLANPIFNQTTPFFGRPAKGRRVVVRVARDSGGSEIKGGFFVNLRGGNIGLAVRSKDGRPPSRGARPIFGGSAFLLYGPSVGQIAFDVFPDIAPDVSAHLIDRFVYHFERLANG
jgi:hypothetical protein